MNSHSDSRSEHRSPDAANTVSAEVRDRIAHAFRHQQSEEELVQLIVEAVARACETVEDE
jgi:hypothetical protein